MIVDALFKRILFTVPFDKDGMNIRALEHQLKAEKSIIYTGTKESHGFWGVLYLVPAFHNPTGTIMSPGQFTYEMKCLLSMKGCLGDISNQVFINFKMSD